MYSFGLYCVNVTIAELRIVFEYENGEKKTIFILLFSSLCFVYDQKFEKIKKKTSIISRYYAARRS